MSLTKMGGQVALTVTPEDLHHFANALLAQSRKEWEEQAASVRKEESEETFLTTEDVCKIFNLCPANLWKWHRTGYLQHIKFGNKNNPDVVLSTKEWRALPKEERYNYTKQTASKDYVERVSYAKVWGKTRKAKSEYLSQLHTDYHNEVGCKYGLARGIPYNELSKEEKRGQRYKNKVVLEAERQAKAALDKVEKYAVLATIDKQELTFPLLNIKTPVQEAMNAVKKELAIPIPALIGQKTWRDERTTNINDAIKALVTAINVERDKQNNGIQASVNNTYTYYMQQLNKLIIENKALQNENEALKAENAKVKQHISQLDENAVRRVTAQKDAVIESLNTQLASKNEDITKLKPDYNTLWEKYKILVIQWNDLTKQPEIIEAVKPKSVIRISLCRTAKRNPLIFPI